MAEVGEQQKKRVIVRRKRRDRRKGLVKLGYFGFRASVYGLLGVALEIVFYNLVRNLKTVPVVNLLFRFDWQVDEKLELAQIWKVDAISLYGQCSLWMFLVYALACLSIEQIYQRAYRLHWALRSVLYGLAIFFVECGTGWVLKAVTGYEIWFYADAGAFFRMTSWFILPIWCITGLLIEYIYRQLMDPQVVAAIEKIDPLDPDYDGPVTS